MPGPDSHRAGDGEGALSGRGGFPTPLPMSGRWATLRAVIYRFLRFLSALALKVYFRRIEVEGVERVPGEGPLLLAPNHTNALVDAQVILTRIRRPVSLTAKSTLAEIGFLRVLMDVTQVIRLYRKQDAALGADRSKNLDSLGECRRRLAEGGAILLFPEGQSHSDPSLRPFRWGAARLALQCVGEEPAVPVRIVPVGLHFPKKERFRADAWIRFGEPIDVIRWRDAHPDADPLALTEHIQARVRGLTLNFERRSDEVLIHWAAELVATGGLPPARLGEAGAAASRRCPWPTSCRMATRLLRERHGLDVDELRRRVRSYRAELKRLGIAPAEVYLPMGAPLAVRFIVREAVISLFGLPLAVWGGLNHLPPAAATRLVERRLTRHRDQVASNTIFSALGIFPLYYVLILALAWWRLPPAWALAYTLSLPICGYAAVLYLDRVGGAWQRARTFFRFWRDPALQQRLEQEGTAIIEALRALGKALEAKPDQLTGINAADPGG